MGLPLDAAEKRAELSGIFGVFDLSRPVAGHRPGSPDITEDWDYRVVVACSRGPLVENMKQINVGVVRARDFTETAARKARAHAYDDAAKRNCPPIKISR